MLDHAQLLFERTSRETAPGRRRRHPAGRAGLIGLVPGLVVAGISFTPGSAFAQQLVANGSFEGGGAGSLTGWVAASQAGSAAAFQIGDSTIVNAFGPISPVEQFNTVGASQGRYYAVTDSFAPNTDGPGTMLLYQNLSLAGFTSFTSASLSFNLQVQDYSGVGPLNATLGTALNYTQTAQTQFVRVDLLRAGAVTGNAFTIGAGDVLQNLFIGGSNTVSPNYVAYNFDVASLLNNQKALGNEGLTLRFAVVSGAGFYHANVDAVSLSVQGITSPTDVAAPEAGSLVYLLSGAATAGSIVLVRRRRRAG
jgi:hypothetical protein